MLEYFWFSSIIIPESVKKPLTVSGIKKASKPVLAIPGIKIGENFLEIVICAHTKKKN